MGEMKIVLPDELEKIFRKAAMKKFGYQKGAMSHAAREAFNDWAFSIENIENYDNDDPINAIKGLMKNVKKSSVELQHEAWNYVTNKYLKKRKNDNRL